MNDRWKAFWPDGRECFVREMTDEQLNAHEAAVRSGQITLMGGASAESALNRISIERIVRALGGW